MSPRTPRRLAQPLIASSNQRCVRPNLLLTPSYAAPVDLWRFNNNAYLTDRSKNLPPHLNVRYFIQRMAKNKLSPGSAWISLARCIKRNRVVPCGPGKQEPAYLEMPKFETSIRGTMVGTGLHPRLY